MSLNHNAASRLFAVCALATLSLTAVAQRSRQIEPRRDRDGRGYMMGPGMMDRGHFGRMCSPRAAGFAEWRLDRLERTIKPTEAQRGKFDEFKAASNKAAETMRTACPTDVPTTMVGRMEAMEKRLDAMSQAMKTAARRLKRSTPPSAMSRKAQLNSDRGRHGRFWRWRDRW